MWLTLLCGVLHALRVFLRGSAVHLSHMLTERAPGSKAFFHMLIESGGRLELLGAVLAVVRDPAMFPVHVNLQGLLRLVGLLAHGTHVALPGKV